MDGRRGRQVRHCHGVDRADVLTLHLRAANGAVFDLQVPMPPVRTPRVRVAGVRAFAIASTYRWTGTSWEQA